MRLTCLVATLGLLGCALPTDAQIVTQVRAKPAVADVAQVFEDRGQRLEILPTLRATPATVAGKPTVQHKLSVAGEGAPIGPGQLGVVFNHALQVQGYLTGEIAFRPRGDGLPPDLDALNHPGLSKVANPNTWIVVAATPGQFLALMSRLKARADLEWVEAVVIYGTATQATTTGRAAK